MFPDMDKLMEMPEAINASLQEIASKLAVIEKLLTEIAGYLAPAKDAPPEEEGLPHA